MFIRENYNHVIEELKPMLSEHYKEVAMYQDKIDLDPDYNVYKELQKQGVLHLFTWRDEGKIKGYNIFFVREHPHYKKNKFAHNDIVYVDPEYRHTKETIEFFEFCEQYLFEAGADVVTYHMKVNKTFNALMEHLIMDHAEHIYTKYIGK